MSLDNIALIGAGVGTLLSGVLGFLLWRTQRELTAILPRFEFIRDVELPMARSNAAKLARALAKQSRTLRELQEKLVAHDPAGAFDSVFRDDEDRHTD